MLSHEHVDSLADDVLLRNIGQGSTDCFALLFHRYCRLVFSVSYRIIRDKAETEDILQEVFFSIHLQQELYPARSSIRIWILQFAYFKALLRRRYLRIRHFCRDEEVSEARDMRSSEGSDLLGIRAEEWARSEKRVLDADDFSARLAGFTAQRTVRTSNTPATRSEICARTLGSRFDLATSAEVSCSNANNVRDRRSIG